MTFCERWDQSSFDPDYENLPLAFFAPMVHQVFAHKAHDPAVTCKGERIALINEDIAIQRAHESPK